MLTTPIHHFLCHVWECWTSLMHWFCLDFFAIFIILALNFLLSFVIVSFSFLNAILHEQEAASCVRNKGLWISQMSRSFLFCLVWVTCSFCGPVFPVCVCLAATWNTRLLIYTCFAYSIFLYFSELFFPLSVCSAAVVTEKMQKMPPNPLSGREDVITHSCYV